MLQPPPGGWPQRRADDVRFVQQAEEIRLLKLDLKAALSQHADIEVNQDWISARRKKDVQTLILIGGLISTGFGWAIYTSGFAKADELKKTQDKVQQQDVEIAKVAQKVDDLSKQTDQANRKLDKLLERTDAGPRRHK